MLSAPTYARQLSSIEQRHHEHHLYTATKRSVPRKRYSTFQSHASQTLILFTYIQIPSANMPLVVPGLQSKDGKGNDELSKWTNQLLGKKLGDTSNETTFAKTDLPSKHRVIGPDSMSTTDFDKDRLNIHTDKDGTVTKVVHG